MYLNEAIVTPIDLQWHYLHGLVLWKAIKDVYIVTGKHIHTIQDNVVFFILQMLITISYLRTTRAYIYLISRHSAAKMMLGCDKPWSMGWCRCQHHMFHTWLWPSCVSWVSVMCFCRRHIHAGPCRVVQALEARWQESVVPRHWWTADEEEDSLLLPGCACQDANECCYVSQISATVVELLSCWKCGEMTCFPSPPHTYCMHSASKCLGDGRKPSCSIS